MAVWQYDLWIVPKEKVNKIFPMLPSYLELEQFEKIDWWKDYSLPDDYRKLLDSFLPQLQISWGNDILVWGTEKGNRIDLSFEENNKEKIEDFFIRVDARQIDSTFIAEIVEFAKFCHGVFFSMEEKHFIEPKSNILEERLSISRARLFVTNPKLFFEKLSKENLIN